MLSIDALSESNSKLCRAHLVLTFIVHLYVHSQVPLDDQDQDHPPHLIPFSISHPLLTLSDVLSMPPVLTYSDTVLYNWIIPPVVPMASLDLDFHTTFTRTPDEAHFYRISALIELRGAEALHLMRQILEEIQMADSLAVRQVSAYLRSLATTVDKMTILLDDMYKGCDPGTSICKSREDLGS